MELKLDDQVKLKIHSPKNGKSNANPLQHSGHDIPATVHSLPAHCMIELRRPNLETRNANLKLGYIY